MFLGLGIASLLSLYTLGPLWHQRMKRYVHGNSSYGRTRFTFDATVSAFYGIYLLAAGVLVALVVGTAVVIAGLVGTTALTSGLEGSEAAAGAGAAVAVLVFACAYVFGSVGLWALVRARVQNLVWNHTRLGPHQFTCQLQARTLMFITLTNLLGILFTLGLFKPFAEVRLMRYVASSFTLVPAGSLDEFLAGERQDVAAVGDEAVDMFDLEIAF